MTPCATLSPGSAGACRACGAPIEAHHTRVGAGAVILGRELAARAGWTRYALEVPRPADLDTFPAADRLALALAAGIVADTRGIADLAEIVLLSGSPVLDRAVSCLGAMARGLDVATWALTVDDV